MAIRWSGTDTLGKLRAIVRETEHLPDSTKVSQGVTVDDGVVYTSISVHGRMFPEGRG